ncbi:MAG: ABC transporter ATP-binding protein [Firmicutes bacterium]|nr:ABC transporter ATP-binding protein [Bacillota bacterium]
MGDSVAKNQSDILLEIEGLKTYFHTEYGVVRAVDGVDLKFPRGKVVGVVGESGCGKSVTALSIMQLVSQPPGKVEAGTIKYYPENSEMIDILSLHPRSRDMRELRGKELAMIFQEPMTSLNPIYSIGDQIIEKVQVHYPMSRSEAREYAIDMLDKVGIPDPMRRVDEYPHQMSGGMRQRAMIAIALACDPRFLIADEPTTALDVTVQAQILILMQDLQAEFGASIMLVTHDLGVVGEMADEVAVMYMGRIVEHADVKSLFYEPHHPYTRGLLRSIPLIGRSGRRWLTPIEGSLPDPYEQLQGCNFAPRCPERTDICREQPPWQDLRDGHGVRCWLYA